MKRFLLMVYGLLNNLFEGFVLQTVWGWFIVPLGIVALPYWTSVIIVLTVGWLTMQLPFSGWDALRKEYEVDKGTTLTLMRITTFLAASVHMLFFSWVIHLIAR